MLANRFTLALVALLGWATLASAEHVRGVVVKVDADTGQVTIEARGIGIRGTVFNFTLGKDAQVLNGNQALKLNELQVGKNVQVSYEMQDGKRVALLVRVNPLLNAIKGAAGVDNTEAKPAAPAANDPNAITGKLRRVAYTEREVVVAVPGGDKETYISLPVAADAKIARDDKAIQFDDLKEEEGAVVRTEMRNGKKVATAVLVGKVSTAMAKPDEPSNITRIRQILKIADVLLELAEKNEKK
jgi:hypothetical protein